MMKPKKSKITNRKKLKKKMKKEVNTPKKDLRKITKLRFHPSRRLQKPHKISMKLLNLAEVRRTTTCNRLTRTLSPNLQRKRRNPKTGKKSREIGKKNLRNLTETDLGSTKKSPETAKIKRKKVTETNPEKKGTKKSLAIVRMKRRRTERSPETGSPRNAEEMILPMTSLARKLPSQRAEIAKVWTSVMEA